jgi:disulfide bond formation protein DsbB
MSTTTMSAIRRLLLGLMTLGLVGTMTDLLFLEHYEDSAQLIPLLLLFVGLCAVLFRVVAGGAASIRILQVVMVLMVAAGFAGIYFHFRGNLEFQLDMDPTASRWELFTKVMHAKAPPALAPAAMVQLGLLGLIFCYRHPDLRQEPLPAREVAGRQHHHGEDNHDERTS